MARFFFLIPFIPRDQYGKGVAAYYGDVVKSVDATVRNVQYWWYGSTGTVRTWVPPTCATNLRELFAYPSQGGHERILP